MAPGTDRAGSDPKAPGSTRPWLALALLVAAYLLLPHVEGAVFRPLARSAGLHMIVGGEMRLVPYATLMVVRGALDLAVVAGVLATLGRPLRTFPLVGPRIGRLIPLGVATGLLVMTGAIVAILAAGAATIRASAQPIGLASLHGLGWAVFDVVGAAGEELFGRVALLLVAERLVGRTGAIVASGVVFAAIHLGNPGASPVWLARLALQGVLLAYAVYRTGSLWWSVGYHAGWNWASAPLFGAAGSGYLDEGHLFDFVPTGPTWITGGAVGPEGSVFAFVAVIVALGALLLTTRPAGETR